MARSTPMKQALRLPNLEKLLAPVGQQVPGCESELSLLVVALGAVSTRPHAACPVIPSLHDHPPQIIGQGGQAIVYHVQSQQQHVAVKAMRHALPFPAFLAAAELWAAEILTMSQANHPCVMRCFGWDIVQEGRGSGANVDSTAACLFRMRIMMPLMAGSLEDLVKAVDLKPARLLRLFAQASSGLRHLHQDLRVLHNDVKAANILLDRDGNAVIADLGLASFLPPGSSCIPEPGGHTKGYAAPEREGKVPLAGMAGHAFACPASDMWALGVEMARLYRRVSALYRPDHDPNKVLPLVYQLLAACFAPRPELRLTAAHMEKTLCLWTGGARAAAQQFALAAFRTANPTAVDGRQDAWVLPVRVDALSVVGSSVAVSTIVFSSSDGDSTDSSTSSRISSNGNGSDGHDSSTNSGDRLKRSHAISAFQASDSDTNSCE